MVPDSRGHAAQAPLAVSWKVWAITAVAVFGLTLAALPSFTGARVRACSRGCAAEIDILTKTTELYNLSYGGPLMAALPRRLTASVQEPLVTDKFLYHSLVDCHAARPAMRDAYVLVGQGRGIACLAHGFAGGRGTAREQLAGAGVSEPAILAAALDRPPQSAPLPFQLLALPVAGVVLAEILRRALLRASLAAGWLASFAWMWLILSLAPIAVGLELDLGFVPLGFSALETALLILICVPIALGRAVTASRSVLAPEMRVKDV